MGSGRSELHSPPRENNALRLLTSLSVSTTLCGHGSVMSMFARVVADLEVGGLKGGLDLVAHGLLDGHDAGGGGEGAEAKRQGRGSAGVE